MKLSSNLKRASENGSVLVMTMCVLTVLSLVAANVLMNSTTRYNTTSKQVKGWKEALVAAEGGADLAFAEVRKNGLDSSTGFPVTGNWASPAPLPITSTNSWELGYTNAGPSFGENNGLSAKVTVDKFQMLAGSTTVGYYRIRSIGTAVVSGLKRTGMDDRMNVVTRGDSLLRKIDFNTQHFWTTYGYGDALATAAATTANGKQTLAVSNPNNPQVSRRVEIIAVPVMPITGAVATSGAYSFPIIDSYSSANVNPTTGAGSPSSIGPTPSAAPYNTASGQANVVDGSSTFNGTVYGDVTTNGGNASTAKVSGVVDNNVPLAPVLNIAPKMGSYTYESQTSGNITPPSRVVSSVTPVNNQQQTVFWYHYPSLSSITVNPAAALYSITAGGIVETTVNIVVDGDANGITVTKGAKVNVFFSGNISCKANTFDNNNVDGPSTNVYVESISRTLTDASAVTSSTTLTSAGANFAAADVGQPLTGNGIPANTKISSVTNATTVVMSNAATATGTNVSVKIGAYTLSTNTSRADHLWYYGEGTNQTISLGSGQPQTNYVCWYAPNADWSVNGNPDFVGCAVVRSFTGNGNNTMHFDTQLLSSSNPLDYRVASYIEDVR